MSLIYSVRFHIVFALALCALTTVALWWCMTSHQHTWWLWLAHWLLSVNVIAFGYYALDKWLAARPWFRIPEAALHTLSAIGGSPAALIAMWAFRHKTIKPGFRILFWCIVVAQLLLVAFVVVMWLQRE